MKKTVAISLAAFIWAQSILPGLGVLELGKLPALFHHFSKHKADKADLSFLHFLEMHYSDQAHHKQDHKEHHKLPFTDHHSTFSVTCVYFVTDRNFKLEGNYYPLGPTTQSVYQALLERDIARFFWQPPRMS
jgi:hypothetical protein